MISQTLGATLFAVTAGIATLFFYKRKGERQAYERYTSPKLEYTVYEGKKKANARTVLVTGGNGFVGKYIVKALVEKGLNVIVFDIVLPNEKDRDSTVTYVRGNLLNREHVLQALTKTPFGQVHSVLHTASLIPFLGVPEKAVWDVNVKGAELILNLSQENGVKSFVYTSSATVILEKNERNARNLTEDAPKPKHHLDTYTTTKYIAEQTVLKANASKDGSFATCALRPAAIFGKGDRNLSDIHVRGDDRFIMGDGQVYLDWTPVESVCLAHILAEEALSGNDSQDRKRVGGNVYNVGSGEELMYATFNGEGTQGETTAVSHWQHPHPSHIPLPLIMFLAHLNSFLYNAFQIQLLSPFLCPPIIDYTQRSYTFSIEKIKKDLKYQPVLTVENAIKNLVKVHRKTSSK
jgi:sterol-4alpha-carboxylate 3-dehydrogenase (decarboxylating)